MAHHVADLITKAENTTGEDKRSAEKDCFNAILAIWSHHAELPNGKRPFEDLEPVIRAIDSLDPDRDIPRYFGSARPPTNDRREAPEVEAWLKMVDGLDYSAKLLIRHCLVEAARASADTSQEWVKLAQAAAADDGVTGVVVRFVSSSPDDAQLEPDLAAEQHRLAKDRLVRLEGFVKLAEGVISNWRQKLRSSSLAGEAEIEPRSKVRQASRPKKPRGRRSA